MTDNNTNTNSSQEEDFEELSPEEIQQNAELEKQILEINKKLAKFHSMTGGTDTPIAGPNQQRDMIEDGEMPEEIKDLQYEELPAIDIRGNVVYTNEMIRKKYHESWPIVRYMHLPYCYNTVVAKVKFWTVMSFAGAYAWQAKRSIESNQGLRGVRALPLLKNYGFIFGLGVTFSLLESIFFEDYCDINSYHYQDNISRKSLANEIKNRFKRA